MIFLNLVFSIVHISWVLWKMQTVFQYLFYEIISESCWPSLNYIIHAKMEFDDIFYHGKKGLAFINNTNNNAKVPVPFFMQNLQNIFNDSMIDLELWKLWTIFPQLWVIRVLNITSRYLEEPRSQAPFRGSWSSSCHHEIFYENLKYFQKSSHLSAREMETPMDLVQQWYRKPIFKLMSLIVRQVIFLTNE